MDHSFVLNHFSLPIDPQKDAFKVVLSLMQGMIAVGDNDSRYSLFTDTGSSLRECCFTDGFTFEDFLNRLPSENEHDLQLALAEIDDKTPMLDFIDDQQIEEIASSGYYFSDDGYTQSIDLLAIAWHQDAILLSVPNNERWSAPEILFAKYTEGIDCNGTLSLPNVSSKESGEVLHQNFYVTAESPLHECVNNCEFSTEFFEWFNALPLDLRHRIRSKLLLADSKAFQGGEPLFKTLDDADGMRELRFSAVQGGAVRILFGQLPIGLQGIFIGWVKKDDADGYASNIRTANKVWQEMKNKPATPA